MQGGPRARFVVTHGPRPFLVFGPTISPCIHVGPRGTTQSPRRSRGVTGIYVDLVPTLNHDSPVPLHTQLSDILREQIKSGALRGRLPSSKSLAQEYEVSHRTSERALDTLKTEGLVVAVIGKGFYTAE